MPFADDSSGPSHALVAGVTVAACVPVLTAILMASGYVVLRRRTRHRTLFGRIIAPGAGPQTTLVRRHVAQLSRLTATASELMAHVLSLASVLCHALSRLQLAATVELR